MVCIKLFKISKGWIKTKILFWMFYKRDINIFYNWEKLFYIFWVSQPCKGLKAIDVTKHLNTAQIIQSYWNQRVFSFRTGSFFHAENEAQLSLTIWAKDLTQSALGFSFLAIFNFLSPSVKISVNKQEFLGCLHGHLKDNSWWMKDKSRRYMKEKFAYKWFRACNEVLRRICNTHFMRNSEGF